jgi:aspartyl-tRNA(Asn)/glutamyl-tRNA(Gln) amidotransferase subunit C
VPSTLTRADARHIADLARLGLSDDELELFAEQLTAILQYAAEVQQIDTTGVPPTAYGLAGDPTWRDDAPVPSLDRQTALANAPDASRDRTLFRVPKVL